MGVTLGSLVGVLPGIGPFTKQMGGSPGYVGYQELPGVLDASVQEATHLLEGVGVKVKKVQ